MSEMFSFVTRASQITNDSSSFLLNDQKRLPCCSFHRRRPLSGRRTFGMFPRRAVYSSNDLISFALPHSKQWNRSIWSLRSAVFLYRPTSSHPIEDVRFLSIDHRFEAYRCVPVPCRIVWTHRFAFPSQEKSLWFDETTSMSRDLGINSSPRLSRLGISWSAERDPRPHFHSNSAQKRVAWVLPYARYLWLVKVFLFARRAVDWMYSRWISVNLCAFDIQHLDVG